MVVHRGTMEAPTGSVVLAALGVAFAGSAAWMQNADARQQPALAAADWKAVDQAMGREGKLQPGDVYKYSFPRGDLRVTAGGVAIKPALALGGWVAFKGTPADAMAMGDLVLLEQEVTPVLTKLEEMGVSPTALHNHLLRESPRVMYMHIGARGAPTKIAQAVHAALALTNTPPAKPAGAQPPAPFPLDTAKIATALGRGGNTNGGVYQVSVPRAEAIRVEGMDVPPAMGVATAINFQPTGGRKAAITGDFVLIASEVRPVMQVLLSAGIEITALHSHMLTEEPRLFFMHFWANDDAIALARGLRGALDRMNVKKAAS
jgi:Domain of Unknown Function (DUF1259)